MYNNIYKGKLFSIIITFLNLFSNHREQLDATVQNCVYTYTSDWVVVRRKYHHHSSSIRPIDDLDVCLKEPLQQQEFEIDDTPDASPDFEHVSGFANSKKFKAKFF